MGSWAHGKPCLTTTPFEDLQRTMADWKMRSCEKMSSYLVYFRRLLSQALYLFLSASGSIKLHKAFGWNLDSCDAIEAINVSRQISAGDLHLANELHSVVSDSVSVQSLSAQKRHKSYRCRPAKMMSNLGRMKRNEGVNKITEYICTSVTAGCDDALKTLRMTPRRLQTDPNWCYI